MNFLLLISIFSLFEYGRAQAVPAVATLYTNSDCTGGSITNSGSYWPNLSQYNWHGLASSVKISGIWIFYTSNSYIGGVHWGKSYSNNGYCINFNNKPNSMKYAGSSPDVNYETITFYSGDWFRNTEEYIIGDKASLSLGGSMRSFIITAGAWTLYTGTNYSGLRICVSQSIVTDMNDIGIGWGSINSVRKGCFKDESTRVIEQKMTPPQMQGTSPN